MATVGGGVRKRMSDGVLKTEYDEVAARGRLGATYFASGRPTAVISSRLSPTARTR